MPQNSVVTELTIDSSGAEKGAVTFAEAMAKAQSAANDSLKSIADNTSKLNDQMGTFGKTTAEAMEKSSFSFGGFAAKLAIGALAATVGLGALYTSIKIIYEVVTFLPNKLAEAWDLGNAKLAEYVALAEKAAAANLTTDFYQRITKAAGDAGAKVDDLTAAMKRLRDQSEDRLGGSPGQNRLNQLTEAGNFRGNAGLDQFANANTSEEKFRSLVKLIDEAIQKGERLAALDVSRTFLGEATTAALEKDSDYLNLMLTAADEMKAKELVSPADVGRALELQSRLDAAEKILSQRWHPIQNLLTQGGIELKAAWVGIVEAVASAASALERFVSFALKMPAAFWDFSKRMFTTVTGIGEQFGPEFEDPRVTAEKALREKMKNPAGTAQARDETNAVYRSVFRDTSKDPNAKPDNNTGPDTSAFDRAEESLRKYIETTSAAAMSIDMTTAAQERLKAVAQLTAAGMKDGLSREAATAKAEMSGLAVATGQAADALAKARVNSQIKFGRDTALLSQDDVQIAQQLKGLYPDVAAALGSVEAQALRTNAAFRGISTTVENSLVSGLTDIAMGTKSAGAAFQDMSKMIIRAIEEMIIKMLIIQPLMRSLQGFMGGGLSLGGASGAAAGATSSGAAGVGGIGGLYHSGGIVGAEPTSMRYVHPAYFDTAPRFHSGMMPDEFPAILQRGEGVFTKGQMAALGGNNRAVNVTVVNQSSQPVSASHERTNAEGDPMIVLRDMVRGIAAEDAANNGPISQSLAARARGYGGR